MVGWSANGVQVTAQNGNGQRGGIRRIPTGFALDGDMGDVLDFVGIY